jgi:hypothetical protein
MDRDDSMQNTSVARPALPTPPTPSLSHPVSPPPPPSTLQVATTPLHEVSPSPPQPLSPTITSPCLSEIKVNSHRAQEQEDPSKIEKYNTAPTTTIPTTTATDTSPERAISATTTAHTAEVGDAFNSDTDDTTAYGDDDNPGGSSDDYIAYDPGSINTSSVFSDATQASTTRDDITGCSSISFRHTRCSLSTTWRQP